MRAAFAVAAAAAIAATAGDLLMLWVANALRPGLGFPDPPAGALRLGAALGVVAIPLYAVGYAAAVARVRDGLGAAAPWMMVAGGLGAIVGAGIHGETAWLIERQAGSAATATAAVGSPLESVMHEPALVVPWAVAAVLVTLVSAALVRGVLVGSAPRAWLVTNPGVATVLLALAGAATELGRSFLVPAAPNVAHAVFFLTAFVGAARPLTPAAGPRAGR
jgi:hypothetical protein